ncbi:hypothetical protein PENSPDRAFT_651953 [Peniophora sp. CONT]|nr:hypothetical protein PENSPDRAFT_651953 [Peniophora sp. CONT]
MDHVLTPRSVSAHSKTPWIFAFITTGLLVAIWGGIFLAWVFKRAGNAHRRRHGKPPRVEKKSVEPGPEPSYVVPPDPALMASSVRDDGLDQDKAREIYAKERHRHYREKSKGRITADTSTDALTAVTDTETMATTPNTPTPAPLNPSPRLDT